MWTFTVSFGRKVLFPWLIPILNSLIFVKNEPSSSLVYFKTDQFRRSRCNHKSQQTFFLRLPISHVLGIGKIMLIFQNCVSVQRNFVKYKIMILKMWLSSIY